MSNKKVPVYTNFTSKVLGYFSQLIVIDDKKIFDFIYNAQIQQEKVGGNKIGFFEITTQDNEYRLTRREMECLFYTIRGGTAKVIAQTLNISNKAVEFHIENLKIKFGCTSKSGLIAKAIEMGYLEKIPFSI
ncbi:MAG: helix-turn-helix transcriptional regulator [Gammaproteobacteria bacterium]